MKKIPRHILREARKNAKEAGTLPVREKRKVTQTADYDKSEADIPREEISFSLPEGAIAQFTKKHWQYAGTTCIVLKKIDNEHYSVMTTDGLVHMINGIYLRQV